MMHTYLKRLVNLSTVLILLCTYAFTSYAYALTPEQKDLIDSGVEYFNIDEDTCAPSDIIPTNPSAPVEAGASIYMVGDSITVRGRSDIETAITNGGYSISGINASSGRAISLHTNSPGVEPTGIDAVTTDASVIASSDVVIVALGTNSGTEDLSIQIPAIIGKIREANSEVSIFWVNLFYEKDVESRELRNAVIVDQSAKLDYRIINTKNEGIELEPAPDLVHPTVAGNSAFAAALVKGLKSGGSTQITASSSVSGYDPLSLTFPNFPDETQTGIAITNYVRERRPNSPWLGIDENFGVWLVNEAKTRNINPLLIVTIGWQENGFGTTDQAHVRTYHNYFGMKGSGPVSTGGAYRGFASPRDGIVFFMDTIKNNIEGGNPNYTSVTNYYEYQSMHQAGRIKYPGEPLGDQGPTGQDGYDPAMDVYVSWTTSDHPNDKYDGNVYNPGIYYKNSIGLINKMLGLTLSDVPVRGSGSGIILNCQTSGGSGSGKIDPSGYSFPLAPQTKFVSGVGVGQTETRHHDETAAFDLFSTDSADVYAISDGKATNVNRSYAQIPGCSSIQFLSNDGYYYWYGHLKNVTIEENEPIQAGQKIAEIADNRDFDSRCWGGAPHLHIDRGCVIDGIPQTAGRDECRDPDFIPFLSKLYEGLPER